MRCSPKLSVFSSTDFCFYSFFYNSSISFSNFFKYSASFCCFFKFSASIFSLFKFSASSYSFFNFSISFSSFSLSSNSLYSFSFNSFSFFSYLSSASFCASYSSISTTLSLSSLSLIAYFKSSYLPMLLNLSLKASLSLGLKRSNVFVDSPDSIFRRSLPLPLLPLRLPSLNGFFLFLSYLGLLFSNHFFESNSCIPSLRSSLRPRAANAAPNDRSTGSICRSNPRAAAAHQAHAL